jgi:hypothetical protein
VFYGSINFPCLLQLCDGCNLQSMDPSPAARWMPEGQSEPRSLLVGGLSPCEAGLFWEFLVSCWILNKGISTILAHSGQKMTRKRPMKKLYSLLILLFTYLYLRLLRPLYTLTTLWVPHPHYTKRWWSC